MSTVNRERKTIQKMVGTIEVNYITLDNLLVDVQRAIELWGPKALVKQYSIPYDDDNAQGGVFAGVLETDDEMTKRIADEERWEAQEFAEFKRLAAKFHSK